MRPDKHELRRRAISALEAVLREPVEVDGEDRWQWGYIAERLLPILRREEAASKGRGDRVELAGELAQVLLDGGMNQKKEQSSGMRPDKDELRRKAISNLRALLREPVEGNGEDRWHLIYIVARLLPILEREERASKGRGDRVEFAGEMVQGLVLGGMSQKEARRLVQERTGLRYPSVASAHQRFRKAGQPSIIYRQWLEHLAASKPSPPHEG
jgi:hypothetical protein